MLNRVSASLQTSPLVGVFLWTVPQVQMILMCIKWPPVLLHTALYTVRSSYTFGFDVLHVSHFAGTGWETKFLSLCFASAMGGQRLWQGSSRLTSSSSAPTRKSFFCSAPSVIFYASKTVTYQQGGKPASLFMPPCWWQPSLQALCFRVVRLSVRDALREFL